MTAATPRPAVVLSGGGANGAYEVGVLMALMTGRSPATDYAPLAPAVLTGTSIGAYNAAVLAGRLAVDGPQRAVAYLEHVWGDVVPRDDRTGRNHVYRFRGNPADLFTAGAAPRDPLEPFARLADDVSFFSRDWLRRGVHFLNSRGGLAQRSLELIDLTTLITREPFVRLLRQTIDPTRVGRSPATLIVATTDWFGGQVKLFTNHGDTGLEVMAGGLVHQAVMASTSMPGVFGPVDVAGRPYVDGAVLMNTPLRPAIVNGRADTVHVVYLDPDVGQIPLARLQNTIDTMDRMFTIMFANQINRDAETARRINRGLQFLKARGEVRRPPGGEDIKPLIESAGHLAETAGRKVPYRQVAIHRYRPREDLSGPLGYLDFGRDRILALIRRGFRDAVEHDCRDCIVPSGAQPPARAGDGAAPGWVAAAAGRG